jgi:hypothetical protein
MSVIPCEQNSDLRAQIERFAEVLKPEAHRLGDHGLDERDFYNSGLFRGAVERVRGQFSATMRAKREFVQHVLNHMEDEGFIAGWDLTEDSSRNDYAVRLPSGRRAVIDLKGCLDGNNTNIFERPADADEFVIWSICTNLGADPRRNAWSGIHTRLSAEVISRNQRVDGLIVWDMVCGTIGRPCPKVAGEDGSRLTDIGPFRVPPACIYLFPSTVPSLASLGTEVRFMLFSQVGIQFYGQSLTTQPARLQQDKGLVDAFVHGAMEAIRFSMTNFDEAVDIFLKANSEVAMSSTGKEYARIGLGLTNLTNLVPEVKEHGFGWAGPAKVSTMADLVIKYAAGAGAEKPDVATLFTNDFVGKLKLSAADLAAAEKSAAPYRKYIGA